MPSGASTVGQGLACDTAQVRRRAPKRGRRGQAVLDEFEDIRPYRDAEVADVLTRLLDTGELIELAAARIAPTWHRLLPGLVRHWVRALLRRRLKGVASVADLQQLFSAHVEKLVRKTMTEFTYAGVEHLPRGVPHLFISNHRDIAVDPAVVNYAIWLEGHETAEIAVGENLFNRPFESDLMRLNKSFVVPRGGGSARAQYAALRRTSAYIRHTLESGTSVWIAQREGRTKDGFDRTDPALLKMLGLAWRKEVTEPFGWLQRVRLVPVSLSYELDPCAAMKARELYLRDRDGEYAKAPDEDFRSIELGILGFKGRVHVHFAPPVEAGFDSAEALAAHVDRTIVGNLVEYPTHRWAAAELAAGGTEEHLRSMTERVRRELTEARKACPPEHAPWLAAQYANLIESKRTLGGGEEGAPSTPFGAVSPLPKKRGRLLGRGQ